MKNVFRSLLPHLGAIVIFFILILVYFYPAFEGKVLQQSDVTQFQGMVHELEEYGKPSGWTGSMFSGMPSYHISGYSTGTDFVWKFKDHVLGAIHSDTAAPIFTLMLTSYILFLILGAPVWLSLLGAIATAFSSYNIIIIVAGHVTKAWALSFVPLILAGLFLVIKRKYLAGFIIFALALALQITSNHLQISYYTALLCAILFIGFLVSSINDKDYKHLGISTGILVAGVLLAVASNLSALYTNYESGQESMRGKAELTPVQTDPNQTERPAEGLDKDYVFAWSYKKMETFTFLIPNLMGGASKPFGEGSESYKALVDRARSGQINGEDANQLLSRTREYWGDKQFTSGPFYLGAVICFLFVFAFLIVPGKSKWWLLGAAVFFVFLAWGKYFPWFNDFMYYNFPLYNKFRTVETALVIPSFIFPIVAVFALKELIYGERNQEKLQNALYWSAGIVGGVCFIFWLMPGMFLNFQSANDAILLKGAPDWFLESVIKDRKALTQADALRSLIFVLLSAGLVYWFSIAKEPKKILKFVIPGLLILVLCDMWQVDKRYLNKDHFLPAKSNKEQSFQKMVADNEILKDPAVSYRVLNLNNPFLESRTSYFHKSIGGYHAAKLGRYQDLIDRRIMKEMSSIISTFSTAQTLNDFDAVLSQCPTLDMLNTKYIIFDPNQPPIVNTSAYGNAWFVDSYRVVNTPDEEMAALETLNPRTEAVLDQKFAENLKGLQITPDSTASIVMTSYAPDILEYKSNSQREGLAILSEVYYPHGWKAYIDGQQVPISRADWILRAIVIPAGEHQVRLVFDPDEVKACGMVTTIASALIMFLLLGGVVFYFYRKSRQ